MLTMKTTMTPGYIDRHQLGDQLGSVSPLKIQHHCPIVVQKDKMLWYRHQPGLVFSFAVFESNIDWLVMSCRILFLSTWFYRFDQSNHVSFSHLSYYLGLEGWFCRFEYLNCYLWDPKRMQHAVIELSTNSQESWLIDWDRVDPCAQFATERDRWSPVVALPITKLDHYWSMTKLPVSFNWVS